MPDGSRRGRRSSAPPAATSERLTSGMPSFAPAAATIRSQASATSRPPATAKPSIAAMIGLRGGCWTIPAKPRSACHGRSPAANAPRSIPEQKPLPAPGEHGDREAVVVVERVERGGDAVRERAVDRVALVRAVERDQQDVVAALGEDRRVSGGIGHGAGH